LKWFGHVERMGAKKLAKRSDVPNVKGKGGEEDVESDGRTALREIWISGRKKVDGNHSNLIPDDRDAKSRTTTVSATDVHKLATD